MSILTGSFMKITLSILLLAILSTAHAFDLDAGLIIFEEEQQKQYQEVQQQAPPQRTREYYQKKWLEQQALLAQPESNHTQEISGQQGQQTQATPDADDLFLAAVNGNNAQIGRLLAQGLDINVSNAERETALHMAAARGQYSTVIYLINHGAYPTARTVKNWIPLHHAVRFRHHDIVNYLVKRGSPVGERTSDGVSAIDMARSVNDHHLLSILGAR